MIFLNKELLIIKTAVMWILNSSSISCARSLVLVKKHAIVFYAIFEQQLICFFGGWGGSCHYQGENTLVDIDGWKLARLCNQTSVVVKRMFDVSGERRGSAKLVLGNSISFSLAQLVQLSYILVTSYSLWIIIFEVTASETHFRLLVSLVAPKRHQLNVQTVFFRVNSWILQANCFPEAGKADCKC